MSTILKKSPEPGSVRLTHDVTYEVDVETWDPRVEEWRWIGQLKPVSDLPDESTWCFVSTDETLQLGPWASHFLAIDELQRHAIAGRL